MRILSFGIIVPILAMGPNHAMGQLEEWDSLVTPRFHRHALEVSVQAQSYGLATYAEERDEWPPFGDGNSEGLGFGLRYSRTYDGTWGAALGLDLTQLGYWAEAYVNWRQYEPLKGRNALKDVSFHRWGPTRLTALATHNRRYNRRWSFRTSAGAALMVMPPIKLEQRLERDTLYLGSIHYDSKYAIRPGLYASVAAVRTWKLDRQLSLEFWTQWFPQPLWEGRYEFLKGDAAEMSGTIGINGSAFGIRVGYGFRWGPMVNARKPIRVNERQYRILHDAGLLSGMGVADSLQPREPGLSGLEIGIDRGWYVPLRFEPLTGSAHGMSAGWSPSKGVGVRYSRQLSGKYGLQVGVDYTAWSNTVQLQLPGSASAAMGGIEYERRLRSPYFYTYWRFLLLAARTGTLRENLGWRACLGPNFMGLQPLFTSSIPGLSPFSRTDGLQLGDFEADYAGRTTMLGVYGSLGVLRSFKGRNSLILELIGQWMPEPFLTGTYTVLPGQPEESTGRVNLGGSSIGMRLGYMFAWGNGKRPGWMERYEKRRILLED